MVLGGDMALDLSDGKTDLILNILMRALTLSQEGDTVLLVHASLICDINPLLCITIPILSMKEQV